MTHTTLDLKTVDTIADVLAADGPVKYVAHAEPGQWSKFVEQCGDTAQWDMLTAIRALVAYLFDTPDVPVALDRMPLVLTLFHANVFDDAPSYRVIVYDISYGQLMAFDSRAQPSWFTAEVTKKDNLFELRLTPTRSLMKLLYKMVI